MAEQVSLEDVGTAEDLLRRLIQERRVLESAANVLQTYRSVLSQLQPAAEQLTATNTAITEARRQLGSVEEQRRVSVKKVEDEVKEYRERLVGQAQEEIKSVQEELTALKVDERDLNEKLVKLDGRYKGEIERYEGEVKALQEELEGLRKEHGALAEAIGKAADFFKR